MNSNQARNLYKRGRAFEYRVMEDFESLGFFVVRTPQSRSPVDVIAISEEVLIFTQCKHNGKISVEEWNKFFHLCTNLKAIPVLAQQRQPHGRTYYELLEPAEKNVRRIKEEIGSLILIRPALSEEMKSEARWDELFRTTQNQLSILVDRWLKEPDEPMDWDRLDKGEK